MIGEFTFKKHGVIKKAGNGHRYLCSRTNSTRCKAYAHVTNDGIIIKTSIAHNHAPYKYAMTKNGYYIKVWL